MMVIACGINVFGSVMTTFFCRGFYFNRPFLFAMGTATVTDILYFCFSNLPL